MREEGGGGREGRAASKLHAINHTCQQSKVMPHSLQQLSKRTGQVTNCSLLPQLQFQFQFQHQHQQQFHPLSLAKANCQLTELIIPYFSSFCFCFCCCCLCFYCVASLFFCARCAAYAAVASRFCDHITFTHSHTHTLAVGIVVSHVCSQLAIWPIVVIGSLLILVAAATAAVVDGRVMAKASSSCLIHVFYCHKHTNAK